MGCPVLSDFFGDSGVMDIWADPCLVVIGRTMLEVGSVKASHEKCWLGLKCGLKRLLLLKVEYGAQLSYYGLHIIVDSIVPYYGLHTIIAPRVWMHFAATVLYREVQQNYWLFFPLLLAGRGRCLHGYGNTNVTIINIIQDVMLINIYIYLSQTARYKSDLCSLLQHISSNTVPITLPRAESFAVHVSCAATTGMCDLIEHLLMSGSHHQPWRPLV
jgi:hypothetical protein